MEYEHVTDTGPAIPARSEEAITMDESTNTATANRYTKWILQGGTAGVSVLDELVADLVARATERIEQAVADGRLDRERADEILAGVEDRANAWVNGERPGGRKRQDGGEGNRGSGR